ncbi:nucleotidyl transferase AbiEii/AbiGii toxin family protein [Aurantimonas sp. MSK8Z-1]|uniref:nucleotidyl transferase AbiEii/AbiGii toxin family protein n=1 Tax=Mangrovibrevibacter kandeliae TaxID=2968473 RepID=UPI002118C893|nr:nucleotidyl transferase AbiEii/AbiGii toxin family protein [Aurantimonas sp. MSK8Z-1]MCW4116118.1 nucleotidyl transferase AbiEii/AbiGii toxin family protein [Aurantimonas sp. MSK8Z-1]
MLEFRRPEHRLIGAALRALDANLLLYCRCFFGGGTAVVLRHGEYRLSLDVDFLCADADGYRELRMAATRGGIAVFFGPEAKPLREFRTDQYGLRTLFDWRGQAIKFEIVREARIALSGDLDAELGVPLLARDDQIAEKLLANADRALDRGAAHRDAIDLGFLIGGGGALPQNALRKAEAAYGQDVWRKLALVLERLADGEERRWTAEALQMRLIDVDTAVDALRHAASATWPDLTP